MKWGRKSKTRTYLGTFGDRAQDSRALIRFEPTIDIQAFVMDPVVRDYYTSSQCRPESRQNWKKLTGSKSPIRSCL